MSGPVRQESKAPLTTIAENWESSVIAANDKTLKPEPLDDVTSCSDTESDDDDASDSDSGSNEETSSSSCTESESSSENEDSKKVGILFVENETLFALKV